MGRVVPWEDKHDEIKKWHGRKKLEGWGRGGAFSRCVHRTSINSCQWSIPSTSDGCKIHRSPWVANPPNQMREGYMDGFRPAKWYDAAPKVLGRACCPPRGCRVRYSFPDRQSSRRQDTHQPGATNKIIIPPATKVSTTKKAGHCYDLGLATGQCSAVQCCTSPTSGRG